MRKDDSRAEEFKTGTVAEWYIKELVRAEQVQAEWDEALRKVRAE